MNRVFGLPVQIFQIAAQSAWKCNHDLVNIYGISKNDSYCVCVWLGLVLRGGRLVRFVEKYQFFVHSSIVAQLSFQGVK